MPKRRVRSSAAQKAASRRNLEKAREAKKPNRAIVKRQKLNEDVLRGQPGKIVPHGKTRLLYHHTSPANAKKIAQAGKIKAGGTGRSKDKAYFSTKRGDMASTYGKAVVTVKVPRKAVRRNELFHKTGEEWVVVSPRDIKRDSIKVLSGRKKRR